MENTPDRIVVTDKEILPEELTYIDRTPEKPMTVTERYVCELYASGIPVKGIAGELGIPVNSVRRLLAKPHVRDFVSELVTQQYAVLKEGRLRILNRIIEDKLEEIEESGESLAGATKKDIVDLLVTMDNMLKEREKADLGTTQDTYVNIIQQVIKE